MPYNSAVLVERRPGHVTLVTIHRPEARHAVSGAVILGLQAAIDSTEADGDGWVFVLTGAGPDCRGRGPRRGPWR